MLASTSVEFGDVNLRSLLIGIELRFDEAPNVRLVSLGQVGNTARRLASAVTDLGAAAKAAVVSCTLVLAVEPLRAVGDATGPFAADGPLAGAGHLVTKVAGGLDVVAEAHGNLVHAEDLVVVSIQEQIPHAGAPVAPGCHAFEGVVEGDSNVRVLQVAPAVHVELANSVHVEIRAERLVEKLDRGDGWVGGMVVTDLVQHLDGLGNRVALCPLYRAVFA